MSKIIGVTVGTPQKPSDFANALKGSASGNPIALSDVSPIQHEIKVKLGGSEDEARGFCVEEVFNSSEMYQFGSDITESGIYVIESVFTSEDSDSTEITFKDGKEVKTDWIEGEPFSVGDMVYVEVNGDNQIFSIMRGATVQKYGKNLFNYKDFVAYTNTSGGSGGIENDTFLGEECFSYKCFPNDGSLRYSMGGIFKENTQYTFSFEHAMTFDNREEYMIPMLIVFYTDGTNEYIQFTGYSTKFVKSTFISKANKTIENFRIPSFGSQGVLYIKKNMQVEVGTSATEFEPYVEPKTYTADEDGIVNGIVGNGESMTLFAEDGVTISAEYNVDTKKYIDKKFAELQALVLEV